MFIILICFIDLLYLQLALVCELSIGVHLRSFGLGLGDGIVINLRLDGKISKAIE